MEYLNSIHWPFPIERDDSDVWRTTTDVEWDGDEGRTVVRASTYEERMKAIADMTHMNLAILETYAPSN